MLDGVGLSEVVREVVAARSLSDGVLATLDTASDPVVAHIDGFGAFETDSVVGDAGCGGIVCKDGSGGLWVAKVGKDVAAWDACLTVEKDCSEFGFRDGRYHCGNDEADDFDGTVRRIGVDGRGS